LFYVLDRNQPTAVIAGLDPAIHDAHPQASP
jgi:hypothetical protein